MSSSPHPPPSTACSFSFSLCMQLPSLPSAFASCCFVQLPRLASIWPPTCPLPLPVTQSFIQFPRNDVPLTLSLFSSITSPVLLAAPTVGFLLSPCHLFSMVCSPSHLTPNLCHSLPSSATPILAPCHPLPYSVLCATPPTFSSSHLPIPHLSFGPGGWLLAPLPPIPSGPPLLSSPLLPCHTLINQGDNIGKFEAKSDEEIFLQYLTKSEGYICYKLSSIKIVDKIYVRVDESIPLRDK